VKNELVTNSDRFKMLKHSTVNPYVFTEEGIYMLAAVLKSDIAIDVNIEIIRTFKKLREFSKHYNALAKKMMELERKNDKQFKEVFKKLDNLVQDTQKTDEKIITSLLLLSFLSSSCVQIQKFDKLKHILYNGYIYTR
jgi:uncharacterized protein (DUF927 family)